MPDSSRPYPLAPYRVLDLTEGGAMFCGQILADLGTDVVAVERPGGSAWRRAAPLAGPGPAAGESLFWRAYARGKRSVELAIHTPEGRASFLKLAANAQFVLESFPPGELARLGLGYSDLAVVNPGIIVVSMTPFGQDGPKADWRANDLTLLAAGGVLLLTGDGDRPPVQIPGHQAMLHAGAEGAAGALIAHHARERTGYGQHVDVSAQSAMILATQGFALRAAWNDPVEVVRSGGGATVGGFHIRYVYPCKDGHVAVTFLFGNVIGPFTQRLFAWMCEEGFVDEATRDKDWLGYFLLLLSGAEPASELQRCTAAVESFTRTKTKSELAAAAMERDLLMVPVNTVADVLASRQLGDRGFWRDVPLTTAGFSATVPGPLALFSRCDVGRWGPSPAPGEHTGELLAEPQMVHAGPTRIGARPPALEGLRVLDLSWVYATPAGVRALADFGATVIHVESTARPDTLRSAQPFKDAQPGAERSGQYASIQANKLGLSLDLRVPAARELVKRIVRDWADVVVESFAPGTMGRWGLDYSALHAVNPGLVMLSSSLNGQSGPDRGLAGFGTMGAHLAGFGDLTGWPDRAPAGPFTAYTDYTAPKAITAVLLAALDHRRRTGEGQHIDLSQIEVALHYITPALLDYQVGGRLPVRPGNKDAEHAPHGAYPCAGHDRWLALACHTDAEWEALARVAGQGWADDPRFAHALTRHENAEALDSLIAAWTRPQQVADLEAALQVAGVPAHRCSTSDDLVADPQLNHRGHWATVPHAELGEVIVESNRVRLSATPHRTLWAGPMFGEHNHYVLADLVGLSGEEMADLAAAGALS